MIIFEFDSTVNEHNNNTDEILFFHCALGPKFANFQQKISSDSDMSCGNFLKSIVPKLPKSRIYLSRFFKINMHFFSKPPERLENCVLTRQDFIPFAYKLIVTYGTRG